MLIFLEAILFGLIEGITEWLPISSTGHMIILAEFIKMDVSEEFWHFFLVVIQLGAILAVLLVFFKKIFPFNLKRGSRSFIKQDIMKLWLKIIIACIPAALVGVLFDDFLEKYLLNAYVVSTMLIIFGIGFIVIENSRKGKHPRVYFTETITFRDAFLIGLFQLLAAVFPGTSRSGATILGALLLGISRYAATEFTFFLAIPVMFGASLLKVVKIGLAFSLTEYAVLGVGMLTAFLVSLLVIKFILNYIKRHDFKAFGYYRIILGILVLAVFFLR